jgi:hypothetical protein
MLYARQGVTGDTSAFQQIVIYVNRSGKCYYFSRLSLFANFSSAPYAVSNASSSTGTGSLHVPEIKPEYKIEGADLSVEGDVKTEGDLEHATLAIVLDHEASSPYVTTVSGNIDDPTREVTIAPVDLTMIGTSEAAGSFTGGGGFESLELAGTWEGGGSSTMTVPLDAEITGALDFKIPGAHIPVDLRLHGNTLGELYTDSTGYRDQFHMRDSGTFKSTKGHYDPPKVEVRIPPFDIPHDFQSSSESMARLEYVTQASRVWWLIVPEGYEFDVSSFDSDDGSHIYGIIAMHELQPGRNSHIGLKSIYLPAGFSVIAVYQVLFGMYTSPWVLNFAITGR